MVNKYEILAIKLKFAVDFAVIEMSIIVTQFEMKPVYLPLIGILD